VHASQLTNFGMSEPKNAFEIFKVTKLDVAKIMVILGKVTNIEYGKIDFKNDIIESVRSTRL